MDRTYWSPEQVRALARRIAARARAGRVVQLKPSTALLCARIMFEHSSRPKRWKLIAAVCGIPECKQRRDCIPCMLKANAVEALLRDEWEYLMKGDATISARRINEADSVMHRSHTCPLP